MKHLILLAFIISLGCSFFGEDPSKEKPIKLNELWRYSLNTAGDAPPTVVGDTLFFAAYPNLYASSTRDSTIFWMSYLDNINEYEDKVFLINDSQVVINQVNDIKAYSRSNGQQLWEKNYDSLFKIISLGRHSMHPFGYYFIGRPNKMVGLSKSGALDFVEDFDSVYGIAGITNLRDVNYINGVQGVNGGFTRGLLLARDYETSKELWRYETDHCGFYEKPIIEDGILYAASRGNSPQCEVVALNSNDGTLQWKTVEKTHADKVLLTTNQVIINSGGQLIAYSKFDGSKNWTFSWESNASLIQPVYESGYVYMSNHGSVFILDEVIGELVHTAPSPGGYIWHLTVNENRLFVQTSRQLIAYEPWHLRED